MADERSTGPQQQQQQQQETLDTENAEHACMHACMDAWCTYLTLPEERSFSVVLYPAIHVPQLVVSSKHVHLVRILHLKTVVRGAGESRVPQTVNTKPGQSTREAVTARRARKYET